MTPRPLGDASELFANAETLGSFSACPRDELDLEALINGYRRDDRYGFLRIPSFVTIPRRSPSRKEPR